MRGCSEVEVPHIWKSNNKPIVYIVYFYLIGIALTRAYIMRSTTLDNVEETNFCVHGNLYVCLIYWKSNVRFTCVSIILGSVLGN